MRKKKVIAMGFTGQMPIAGVIWQHVHYIVGLQRLGHEVYYLEDTLNPFYNPATFEWSRDYRYGAEVIARLAREYGFEGRWGLLARDTPAHDTAGLPKEKILELYRDADAVVNICGSLEPNEDILQNQNLIYVESDPGVEQIRVDQKLESSCTCLQHHKSLFTFGENIGTPEFPVPLHGYRWMPTRQPVVTDLWKTDGALPPGAMINSIANLSTGGKDVQWNDSTYLWNKSREFLKFIEAPARSGETFELATNVKDEALRRKFEENRWCLTSPDQLSTNWEDYRSYIRESKGEFTAAKDVYVRLNTGWFSDRSACYLAAGRPVITQETGFTRHYGGNGGLFAYSSLHQIPDAVREINADYTKHSRAAFDVAAEYFEATKVLGSLLDRAGL